MARGVHLLILGAVLVGTHAWADGYVGTYTRRAGSATGSVGIYHFQWNPRRGELREMTAATAADGPSYLVLHPRGGTLYAVNEGNGHLAAYAIGRDGALTLRNEVSAQGKGPCHLAMDPAGHRLYVSNYGTGNLVAVTVAADGALGEVAQNIEHHDETHRAPHAHQAVVSPDGRFVLSVDLGLDKVFIYRLDRATGVLTPDAVDPFDAPAGSGPRHLVFSRDGRRVYLLTELSAQLLTLGWDAARGALRLRDTADVLPQNYAGEKSGAEITLHPNGRWLYTSSRGTANDIAAFALDRDGLPHLTAHEPAGGITPRFIGIAPHGQYLLAAGQGSDDISVFRITASGRLEAHGRVSLPAPVDILWR